MTHSDDHRADERRRTDDRRDDASQQDDGRGEERRRRIPRVRPSRRRFLQAAAATGAVAGLGGISFAQDTAIELGGEAEGWQGRAPAEIEGETNPTLSLEEGQTYQLTWENLDGQAHNVVIVDADGEELERTETVNEQGATQTLEFEATRAMSEYYCEVHPQSMRGDISLGEAGDEDGETEDSGEAEPFFPRGTSIGVEPVAEGMTAPTDFADPGDDTDRQYVTDQTGEVWIVGPDGREEEPFVDVSDRMLTLGEFNGSYADPEQDYDERGLLGIEFHPDYEENRRVFLHYSAPPDDETPDGWDHVEVVSEFEADEEGTSADPDSERVLMEFQKPQYNHDSGPIAFGPDGYLYVPMGDGGGANDDMYGHVDDWYDDNAGGNGQDVSENLLGSVLRIDVDSQDDDRPYGIPEDNPLVDDEDALDEHYAWGFRNPFGISFDSEGALYVADAGQNLYEEANLVEAGGNYGWNVKEGTHCFSTETPSQPPEDCPDATPEDVRGGEELLDPIVEYPHVYQGQNVGIVIVGGHVYENDDVEGLQGKYLFGDWTRDPAREGPDGRLFAATPPEGDEASGDDDADDDGDGENGMDGEDGEDGEDDEMGNGDDYEGDDDANDDGDDDYETEMGDAGANETSDAGGNETNGNETAENGTDVEAVPTEGLWDMEELVVEGSDDGRFYHFVRMFGRGSDGEHYVLANRRGVPDGDTGVVFRIVPPGEGASISAPEMAEGTGDDEANETEGNETAANETTGNETAADD